MKLFYSSILLNMTIKLLTTGLCSYIWSLLCRRLSLHASRQPGPGHCCPASPHSHWGRRGEHSEDHAGDRNNVRGRKKGRERGEGMGRRRGRKERKEGREEGRLGVREREGGTEERIRKEAGREGKEEEENEGG